MKKELLVIISLFILELSFAQTLNQQRDSLLSMIVEVTADSTKANLYNELSRLHAFSQPGKAIQFAQESLIIGTASKNDRIVIESRRNLCLAHYYQGTHSDTIRKHIELLEKDVKDKGTERDMIQVHWWFAMYYANLNQHEKVIEFYVKALEILRKYEGGTDSETGLLYNIGSILIEREKHEEALGYFEDGLEIVEGSGLKADLLFSSGIVYNKKKEYEKALTFFKQSYHFYSQNQDSGKMALSLAEEGKYYDRQSDFEQANKLYSKAYDLIQESGSKSFLPNILSALASHYQKRKMYSKAIEYGEKALAKNKEQKRYDSIKDTYAILSESYAANKNYKKAYEIRGEEMVYRDSMVNAELLIKVEALETQFKVEQKEIENELLKVEAVASQKKIQTRNIMGIALFLGLLLLGSWALVIFRAKRKEQKHNKELEEIVAERTNKLYKANKNLEQANYELKTFNYIASHDIKEPIRNLGNFTGLIYKKLPEQLKLDFKYYFDTIEKSTSQLYTLIEDFSKYTELSKDNDIKITKVDLNIIVDNIQTSMMDSIRNKNASIINKGLPTIETNSSMIFIIMKNIVENGVKFNKSEQPTIILRAKEQQEHIEISIDDNGIGIESMYHEYIFEMFKRLHTNEEYKGSGTGLAIAKLLLDKLGGYIEIENIEQGGSIFKLFLPKKYPS